MLNIDKRHSLEEDTKMAEPTEDDVIGVPPLFAKAASTREEQLGK